jgi:hypothetical protein
LIRKVIAAVAVSALSALAFACSSGPSAEEERVGTTSQAIYVCRSPFTTLYCDAGDGTRPICSCEMIAGPGISPTPPGKIGPPSCPTASVEPPNETSGCTYGVQTDVDTVVWLCPVGSTLADSELCVGGRPLYSQLQWLTPDNGCFGPPQDSSYAYVVGTYGCWQPGTACGSACL